jgi:large subunit ribosomal protein L35
VEQFPKLEGRQMIMMIAPGRKKKGGRQAGAEAAAEFRSARSGSTGKEQALAVGWSPARSLGGGGVSCCPNGDEFAPLPEQVARGHKSAEGSRRLTSTKKRSIHMPKMKTKSGAKKRFRVRPGGTVKRGQAFKRHILTKKTTKNKRHLRGRAVHETNMGHMAQMLPGRPLINDEQGEHTCLASNVV